MSLLSSLRAPMADKLATLLGIDRIPTVVDIGANPIDGDPPYKEMLRKGLCRVIGFEPQADALKALRGNRDDELYLPYVIGTGDPATLHVTRARGMTSLLRPDANTLALFTDLAELGVVEEELKVDTVRLDDVAEIDHLDFLKIDVQGLEAAVFDSGRKKLASAVAIQTEVSFVPTYENQPTIGDVDLKLRSMGFIPHCFAEMKLWPLAPAVVDGDRRKPLRQIVECDLVYVRDFRRTENMTGEQWKLLAMIAHHCYQSYDLALRAVIEAIRVGAVSDVTAGAQYCEFLGGET